MSKVAPIVLICLLVGCMPPDVLRPVRLYDLDDGSTLEALLPGSSGNTGMMSASDGAGETYKGEYVFYDMSRGDSYPPGYPEGLTRAETGASHAANASFAELYGFSKEAPAKPAGTAILVGDKGTVIEIVFYKIGYQFQFGDGVGKDNKGRRYRVFMSSEIQ